MAVRRFARSVDRGADAKAAVDAAVDACAVLVNLRTAISRYRQPKSASRFFRHGRTAGHRARLAPSR